MRRCMEVVEWGVEAAQARERTVSFEEAGWASVEARKDLPTTTPAGFELLFTQISENGGHSGATAAQHEHGAMQRIAAKRVRAQQERLRESSRHLAQHLCLRNPHGVE